MELPQDRKGRSKGFALVEYATNEGAAAAVAGGNGLEVEGRYVT